MSRGENKKKEELGVGKQWRENYGVFLELKIEEESCQACRRTRLSSLKSELMCELHCNNK
jgi:hypothetical protein